MGGGDLLIRGDVFEFVHLSHFALDDRRPMVELLDIGVGQRVLIEGTAQTSADADVLPGLHEEFDAFDRGHLGAQASDDLAGGFRALIVWHQLNEHAGRVLGRVVGAGSSEGEDPGDGGIMSDDFDDLLDISSHGLERTILARVRLAKDKAGILLGEKPLGNDDVEVTGRDDQYERRQKRRQLMAQDKPQSAVVEIKEPDEKALGDLIEATRPVQPLLLQK